VHRLPNIQMLRACAALMIVIYHCGIETGHLAQTVGGSALFDESPWGAGVPLFFAISGFIMVVTSGDAFGSLPAARSFMRRRLIRIVPLYWTLTTVVFVIAVVAPRLIKATPGDYLYVVASYLYWPYVRLIGDVRPLVTPGWTLNLEMLFYTIFAVALIFPRRTGYGLLFGSLALLVAARVGGLLPGVALNFWGDPIVLGFVFGAAVGILYNRGVRLSAPWAVTLLVIGFAAFFQPWRLSGLQDDLLPRLAWSIPSTLVLIAVALSPQVDEGRALWRPALLIGDASYSLYLLQEFLLRMLYLVWLKGAFASMVLLWMFVPAGIAISVAACVASYWYFEQPVARWLKGHPLQTVIDALRGSRRLATQNAA